MSAKFLPLPSQSRLRELFDYNLTTGELIRKTKNTRWNNKTAGSYRTRRGGKPWLVLVCVDGVQYPVHRLIWRWMTGDDPDLSIDHIDRNPFNNCWDNLRLADAWSQAQNREWIATFGHTGVSYHKASKKWQARKVVNGKRIQIGLFATKDQAIEAMNDFMDRLKKEDRKWTLVSK